MNRRIFVLVLALMSMLLLIAPATLAQETFGLSEADFALLTNANANVALVEGANVNFDISFDAGMLSETGPMNFSGNALIGKDAADEVLAHVHITAYAEGESFDLELRIVDGMVYANDGSGWETTTLEEFSEEMGLGDTLPALGAGDDVEEADAGGLFDMSAFDGLDGFDPTTLITMTRVADAGNIAHFNINVDLQSLITSDAFLNTMLSGGEMMGDDSMAQMIPMLLMLFQDLHLSVDEYVDVDAELVTRFVLNFGMAMDTAAFGDTGAEPMVISFTADVEVVEFNPVFTVEAPE